MTKSQNPLNLAVFLSGGGTTLQNLIDQIEQGKLNAKIALVMSSRKDAYGLVRAAKHGITAVCVNRRDYTDLDEFNREINRHLSQHEIDLIIMAGFLSFFKPDEKYKGKMMNIHPALIPAFCGKGFYGHRVHEAVLNYGVKISGCTVHFADEEGYDMGPIILQAAVEVKDDDTVETLAARVFEKECELYPKAIQLYAEGRLKVEGRHVRIL
ncbi:MAG: phosphoribosylglycinamide formyltransferase [Candidatus Tectomicrobia bacterium]|nr:phosphoribosylglycinamide formyltransferase [Candidatus Tectomicrobia bacterium]